MVANLGVSKGSNKIQEMDSKDISETESTELARKCAFMLVRVCRVEVGGGQAGAEDVPMFWVSLLLLERTEQVSEDRISGAEWEDRQGWSKR